MTRLCHFLSCHGAGVMPLPHQMAASEECTTGPVGFRLIGESHPQSFIDTGSQGYTLNGASTTSSGVTIMRAQTSILMGLTAMAMLFAACQTASTQQTESNPFHSHGNPFHNGSNPFHNHFAKDGPFVVGGLCPEPPGASVTFFKGGLVIRGENQSFGSSTVAGWEVFNSHPGVNPGSLSPTASSVAPVGTYSFTVSGLPSSHVFVNMASSDSEGGYNNPDFPGYPISNGTFSHASVPVMNPGATLVAEYFFICTDSNTPLTTYTVKDFKVNGKPIGIDTTHLDNSGGSTGFNWCNDL